MGEKLKVLDPLGEWENAIKLIEEQSFDKNGVIDYEEFLLNLHPNFEETPEWIPDLFKKMPSISFGKLDEYYDEKDNHKQKRHKKSSKHRHKNGDDSKRQSGGGVDVNGNYKQQK